MFQGMVDKKTTPNSTPVLTRKNTKKLHAASVSNDVYKLSCAIIVLRILVTISALVTEN